MKVVLLAGGYGTRISEETDTRPKPMVEIGGKPIFPLCRRNLNYWPRQIPWFWMWGAGPLNFIRC